MNDSETRSWNPLTVILLLSGGFFAIFLIVSAAIFFSRSNPEKPSAMGGAIFGRGSVAVIELNGVIMDSKKVLTRLESVEENPEIKAVVLRLNSPGGSVAPSQEIYEAVKNYKKPLVVSMASVAASGAYYIAMGAKKVYANPGTITGSIGVIMEFANLSKLYDWAKIQRYSLKTGKYKDAGAEYREMTAEEKALLQGMIDDVLIQFKKAVSEGRHLSMEQVTAIADGRIFSGSQAKALHLVDELGTLHDAIEDVAKQAKLKGKPNVVYPDRKKNLWWDLILDGGPGRGSDDSESSEARVASNGGVLTALAQLISGHAPSGTSLEQQITGVTPGIYWLWTGFSR